MNKVKGSFGKIIILVLVVAVIWFIVKKKDRPNELSDTKSINKAAKPESAREPVKHDLYNLDNLIADLEPQKE